VRKIASPLLNDYITCQVVGRTGNMMFELAHGYAKALKYNRQFVAPYNHNVLHFRNNLFKKFDFYNVNSLDTETDTLVDSPFEYSDIRPNEGRPTSFVGYYQSEKYFEGYSEAIRSLYSPPLEFIQKTIKEYPFLATSTVAAISIRRGDYLNFPTRHPVISLEYIDEAYKSLPPHDILFVMSDDMDWCKENIKLPNVVFNDHTKFWDHEGIWLLSLCDHFIISNSTFSWWGAWLSKSNNKVVIVPEAWFGPDITYNTKDIYCVDWIKMPSVCKNGLIIPKT
jgi:hypothetical protein